MNFFRRLIHSDPPADPPPPVDLARHDELIAELDYVRLALRRLNREPISMRVRGEYDHRPVRGARWQKGNEA